MKILLINTNDIGGAASACIRLHYGLLDSNLESKLLLKTKNKGIINSFVCPEKATIPLSFGKKLKAKMIRIGVELKLFSPPKNPLNKKIEFLKNRAKSLENFSFTDSDFDITESPYYKEADLIHLHWVADFLDWKTFFAKNTKPIVWTLHDQNPFLGGEHYDERYSGINEKGYPLSRVKTELEVIKEIELTEIKYKSLQSLKNMWVVSPSKWLYNSASSSKLLNRFSHFLIPYGTPTHIFKNYNSIFCRDVFGLCQNKKIILFVADSFDNFRKGYSFLTKAIESLDYKISESAVFCAIGETSHNDKNSRIIELGKIHDERLMAMAYSAADLFVVPSLEDNFPNTMLESLCCGTPILAFPTGGIVDVIEDGVNGFFCENISVNSLLKGLSKFLNGEIIFDRTTISKISSERFALSKQANEYIKLYEQVLAHN